MRAVVKILVIIVLIGLITGGAAWYMRDSQKSAVRFRTAEVTRGSLTATISATGTVEPEEVIDVGAQVAGLILSFGTDKNGNPIDYGSQVQQGDVLARIDDALYAADKASADAAMEQAHANVVVANANLEQMQAKFSQAKADWDRAQQLGPSDALARTQYDAYRTAYEAAQANVTAASASIVQAQASVSQASAQLLRAQRNLDFCTIKSPVNGVIIDRRVNIGQTVVSSLNAPSLFLIAKDLTRMQVWVSVNEADIGSIHAGQTVVFTVDAFPGEKFYGQVKKVRLNASMTQNVVTYTVEVQTDNSSRRLLPYLSANAQFEVAHRDQVLMVPSVALRWKPSTQQQIAADAKSAASSPPPSEDDPAADAPRNDSAAAQPATQPVSTDRQHRAGGSDENGAAGEQHFGTVWVEENGLARAVRVQIGMTDGTDTEVSSPQLRQAMRVIVGEIRPDEVVNDDARNPFLPQLGNRKNTGSGARQSPPPH